MKLLGNDPKAAEYYRKAISVSPNDIPLRLSYAKLLDKLGEDEAAVEEFNYILTKNTNNQDVLYSLERIYKKKLDQSPSDADITSNLGAILQKQGKLDEALTYYKKAEQLDPSNVNTRINTGTLYQQKGDYKTAIIAYDSVLILYPDNINANLYKAQCQAALGDTKGAQTSFKKVLSLDPANVTAQNELFANAKSTMTVTQYIDYLKKNANPDNVTDMLYSYALELHKEKKFADAITLYKEVLPKDSTGEIYTNLAIAQNEAGQYETAVNTLETARSKFADNTEILSTLNSIKAQNTDGILAKAEEYYNAKDYKNAIAEYSKLNPPTFDTMIGIASSYQNLEDSNSAIEYYKKALSLKPTDSDVAFYIGALYADNENYSDAETYLNKAIALNKNNTQAVDLLNQIKEQNIATDLNKAIELYDGEKYEESLSLLNQVIAQDSKNAYAFYYRGMIYDSKKKTQEAISDFKKALAINSSDLLILNYMLAADYDTLGKYKEAYGYYTTYANSTAENDEYKQYAKSRAEELKNYAK